MLFGLTEEEVAESFSTIGDEVLTFSAVEGKKKLGNDPYSGWKAETSNVYSKGGPKRNFTCTDKSCDCQIFRRAKYAPLKIEKHQGAFALVAGQDIGAGEFIIEFIGKVSDADTVKDSVRESSSSLLDHDIPFVLFCKDEEDNEVCIDARRRGNIARFIHHSCSPNSVTSVVTARGRTFVGLYAQKKILKGSLITIPFSFTGKKFTSTAKCFCDKENCSVSKWYQHRSTQVVRRLKIAESLLSDNIVVELPRKSRLRAEEKKLRSIIGETPVKRGRESKDSILAAKKESTKLSKRKESRAALKAQQEIKKRETLLT